MQRSFTPLHSVQVQPETRNQKRAVLRRRVSHTRFSCVGKLKRIAHRSQCEQGHCTAPLKQNKLGGPPAETTEGYVDDGAEKGQTRPERSENRASGASPPPQSRYHSPDVRGCSAQTVDASRPFAKQTFGSGQGCGRKAFEFVGPALSRAGVLASFRCPCARTSVACRAQAAFMHFS